MQKRMLTLAMVGVISLGGTSLVLAADDPRTDVSVGERVRGDYDGDGLVGISDAVRLLAYLFQGAAEPDCLAAADHDGDGVVGVADAISILETATGQKPGQRDLLAQTAPPSATVQCDGSSSSTGEVQEGQTYTIFHNGNICLVSPCPVWTITTEEGRSRDITHLDYSALGLSPEQAARTEARLSEGIWEVVGLLRGSDDEFQARRETLLVVEIVGMIHAPQETD